MHSSVFKALHVLVLLVVFERSNEQSTTSEADIRQFRITINSIPSHRAQVFSIMDTWGAEEAPLFVVPGTCADEGYWSSHSESKEVNVLWDPDIPCAEYPPLIGWMRALFHMSLRPAKWHLKCDDDSYVNVREVQLFLTYLEDMDHNPIETPYYFGKQGRGRAEERELLGLQRNYFILGGPCIFLSNKTLTMLAPHLKTCMLDPAMRMHSDTQLARCLLQLGVTAGLPELPTTMHTALKYTMFLNFVGPHPLNGSTVEPFKNSTVPLIPFFTNRYNTRPLTVHAVKDPQRMLRLHSIIRDSTRPLEVSELRKAKNARRCVHNTLVAQTMTTCTGLGWSPYPAGGLLDYRQARFKLQDTCSIKRQECDVPQYVKQWPLIVDHVYIIALNTSASHVQHLFDRLSGIFASVQIWPAVDGSTKGFNLSESFLSPGELGLLSSYEQVLRDSRLHPHKNFAIFEEDALLHLNFSTLLESLFSCPECSCHIQATSMCTPGVLLLGATIHSAAAWQQIESIRLAAKPCVSLPLRAYGSYAVIYSAQVVPTALYWLLAKRLPFDWLWPYLSMEGYYVKVALPFLTIMNLHHESTVESSRVRLNISKRLRQHHWDVTQYDLGTLFN
jgi:hypothetical protein